jgi:hypothetical protein
LYCGTNLESEYVIHTITPRLWVVCRAKSVEHQTHFACYSAGNKQSCNTLCEVGNKLALVALLPPPQLPQPFQHSSCYTAETERFYLQNFASLHNYIGSLDRGNTRVEKNDGSWRNSLTVATNTWKAKMPGWFCRVFDPQHLAPTYSSPGR